MTTLSHSIAQKISTLFSNVFGLSVRDEPNITKTDIDYTVYFIHGTGSATVANMVTIQSSDSPAILALKLVRENPHLAQDSSRIWIHDPLLNNKYPHRFRCMVIDGEPRVRLIDPRVR
jgi:hypothetical protein